MAAVFFCQPLGQMLATLMAYAATVGFKNYIKQHADPSSCSIYADPIQDRSGADCARTVDQVWRLVSGLGAFPAALAIISRLTIPESVSFGSSYTIRNSCSDDISRSIGSST